MSQTLVSSHHSAPQTTLETITQPQTIIAYFTYDDARQSRDVTNWSLCLIQELHDTTEDFRLIFS